MADMQELNLEEAEKVCGGADRGGRSPREKRKADRHKVPEEKHFCPNCNRTLFHFYTLEDCPFCGSPIH